MTAENDIKQQRKKRRLLRQQRGMALLITVMTVSLLVAVTIQYHKTTWQQYLVSNNYKVDNQLRAIADSGVNIAKAILEADPDEVDSLQDSWATIENESFGGIFPAGSLKLQIVDLSGRLQVNSLVQNGTPNMQDDIREMLKEILLTDSFAIEDDTEATSIVAALVDWIDDEEPEEESDFGAESSYYRSLSTPYGCRNGPIQYIEELLLIKGITPALLFGSGNNKGLADYLTVTGEVGENGKVNMNTAPLAVIKSFDPLIDTELLDKLDEFRRDEGNKERLDEISWYKDVAGWGSITLNENLLTKKSSYFQINATATLDTLSHSVVAVVKRDNGNSNSKIKLLWKKRSDL